MKKTTKNITIDTKKLQKMATLKVENREKMTGKTLTENEKNALIKRHVENPHLYFQRIPIKRNKTMRSLIKSKRGGKRKTIRKTEICNKCYKDIVKKYNKCLRKCDKKSRKITKRRKSRKQSKKFRKSKRK